MSLILIALLSLASLVLLSPEAAPPPPAPADLPVNHAVATALFETADRCMACHNGVSTSTGEDVSIGFDWRASMMANAARDPYWQAAVRRETLDHPGIAVAEGGEIAWAFRKGSPLLANLLADFAREHREGTLLGNIALRRYLGSEDRVVNPLDRSGGERLQAMLPVFERYADRYDLDPLLLISQAYQESRLDPDAVSPVGAVGIMQLMPSTAADPNVGIPDITSLENNVHAGAKYLRFLLDRYFSDGELDPVNEHLFAFAAYNAGATRVSHLRAEAADVGLDPDRWFQNVEVVAARRIGRETVQYVSNIYKYYLTYSRIAYLEDRERGAWGGPPPSKRPAIHSTHRRRTSR
jgi:soluble lytic murein transglycosylase-like protein